MRISGFKKIKINPKPRGGHNFTSTEVSYVSEEEVNNINELINLAYSYNKFSMN